MRERNGNSGGGPGVRPKSTGPLEGSLPQEGGVVVVERVIRCGVKRPRKRGVIEENTLLLPLEKEGWTTKRRFF